MLASSARLAALLIALCPLLARAAAPENSDGVLDAFVAAITSDETIADDRRDSALKLVAALRESEDARDLAITEGLRQAYPEFDAGLAALGEERADEAIEALTPLAESEQPFLAAESSLYLARAQMFNERYEEAMPKLVAVTEKHADHTLTTGEATFLRGVCEMRLLKRKEAKTTFDRFLDDFPNTSQRMQIAAWQMQQMLAYTKDGSLADVLDHMDYSRRRLALKRTGKTTRDKQEDIVAMLAKLIKDAEKQESQGSGQSESESQSKPGEQEGSGQGRSGQGGSQGNDQSPSKTVRKLRVVPKTPWDHLRNKRRESPAFAALKAKFPARYQDQIEQYYRNLLEDPEQE